MKVTWQQHLERCAKLNIAPLVMSDAEWHAQNKTEPKAPRKLTDSEREKLLMEAHDVGRSISGMKLRPETLAAIDAKDKR